MATCSPKPRAAGRKCRFYPEMSQSFWKLIGCPHGRHPFVIQRQLKQQSCEKTWRFLLVSYCPVSLLAFNRSKQATLSKRPPCSTSDLCGSSACRGSWSCFIWNLHSSMCVGNGIMWETQWWTYRLEMVYTSYNAFMLILGMNYYWVYFGNGAESEAASCATARVLPGAGAPFENRSISACQERKYIKSGRICQSMVRKLKYVRQVGGFGLLERARGANLEFNQ